MSGGGGGHLKNILSYILRIALSAILLAYLFYNIDVAKIWHLLENADFRYILYAFIAFAVIHVFLLLRWLVMIAALGLSVPLKNVVHYFFVGLFFNLFLPTSTGGDVVKTVGLCRHTEYKARVVASVVLDRLSGFVGIVLTALLAYLAGYGIINDPSLLIPIVVLAGVPVTLLLILFNEPLYAFGSRIFRRWPRIEKALMDLHYDVVLLKNKKIAFVQAILLSFCSQAVLALTFYLIARALHQEVAFVYFLIFVPLICVVSSLPSIGGLGVRDAGAVYLFAKAGLGAATALSLSLLNFVFMVVVGLVGGVLYVTPLSPGRIQHHQKHAGVGPS